MNIFAWMESRTRHFRWYDFALLKLAVAAFALMLAKLCPPLISFEWHVYLIIALIAAAPLYYKMFKSR